jgi:hypothetical protein
MSEPASRLNAIEERVIQTYLAALTGEPFHPEYKKHRDLFAKLVRADLRTEREAKKYFKDFALRINQRINWFAYNQYKAAVNIDDFVQIDWEEEAINLRVILSKTLIDAVVAGGESIMRDTGISDDWDDNSPPVIRFLRDYTFDLVKGLNNTSRDRLREALTTSLELGESTDEAQTRIEEVISDPRRAAAIARTESVRSYAGGRLEVGKRIGADRKGWSAFIDDRTSARCRDGLNGQVVEIGKPFKSKLDGWEGDGPPSHPNCILGGQEIFALDVLTKFVARYDGPAVRISTSKGTNVAVTPNHLMLTRRGWVPASELKHGDYLIHTSRNFEEMAFTDPDVKAIKSLIEEVFITDGVILRTMPATSVDFHGDGVFCKDVDIVNPTGGLRSNSYSSVSKFFDYLNFIRRLIAQFLFNTLGSLNTLFHRCFSSSNSSVSSFRIPSVFSLGSVAHHQPVGHSLVSDLNTIADEEVGDRDTANVVELGELVDRHAGLIELDEVVGVRRVERFQGNVYDLTTNGGWYTVNSIITHNCRCHMSVYMPNEKI